jgi:hypothetical protein
VMGDTVVQMRAQWVVARAAINEPQGGEEAAVWLARPVAATTTAEAQGRARCAGCGERAQLIHQPPRR